MTEPCILAVDPGLTGALAWLFPSAPDRVAIDDMPVVDNEVEPASIGRRIAQMGPTLAVLERVGPMLLNGKIALFGLGMSYGIARTAIQCAGVPLHLVTPQTWKKHFRLKAGDDGKEHARALALRLFPASAEHFARKKDHNRAEAALIARYALDTLSTTAARSGFAGDGGAVASAAPLELVT